MDLRETAKALAFGRKSEGSPLATLPPFLFEDLRDLACCGALRLGGEELLRNIEIGCEEKEEEGKPWTCEFWLKVRDKTLWARSVILAASGAHGSSALKLVQWDDPRRSLGVSKFNFFDTGFPRALRASDGATHLAWVYDGNLVSLFVNGAQVGSPVHGGRLAMPSDHIGTGFGHPYRVLANEFSSSSRFGEGPCNVDLREVVFWKEARTPLQLARSFQQGGVPSRPDPTAQLLHYIFDPRNVSCWKQDIHGRGMLRVRDLSGSGNHGTIRDLQHCSGSTPVIVEFRS